MLAQISQGYLVGGIVGAVTLSGSIVIIFIRHMVNSDRHPKTNEIVFRRECEKDQNTMTVKLDNIVKTMDERHKDTKKDLDEIKDLIRNNGKLRGYYVNNEWR